MKKIALFSFLVCIALALGSYTIASADSTAPVSTSNQTVSANEFSINLPAGFPVLTKQSVDQSNLTEYRSTKSEDNFFYVAYVISPRALQMDKIMNAFLQGAQGTLVRYKDSSFKGYPIRHVYFTLTLSEGSNATKLNYGRIDFLSTPDKFYMIEFSSDAESDLYEPDIEQAFDSFSPGV